VINLEILLIDSLRYRKNYITHNFYYKIIHVIKDAGHIHTSFSIEVFKCNYEKTVS